MKNTSQFRRVIETIGSLVAQLHSSRFVCGDCERNAQCGLPPHDDCVLKLARDVDRLSPRRDYLYPAVWPRMGARHEVSRY